MNRKKTKPQKIEVNLEKEDVLRLSNALALDITSIERKRIMILLWSHKGFHRETICRTHKVGTKLYYGTKENWKHDGIIGAIPFSKSEQKVLSLLKNAFTAQDISRMLEVSASYVYRAKKNIDRKRKIHLYLSGQVPFCLVSS